MLVLIDSNERRRFNVHVSVGEVVGTGLDGRLLSGHEGGGESLDVRLLIVGDVVEVVVVVGRVAGVGEVLEGELFEGTVVEVVLEVLQGQSELEDVVVQVGALGELSRLDDGGSKGGAGQCGNRSKSDANHCRWEELELGSVIPG